MLSTMSNQYKKEEQRLRRIILGHSPYSRDSSLLHHVSEMARVGYDVYDSIRSEVSFDAITEHPDMKFFVAQVCKRQVSRGSGSQNQVDLVAMARWLMCPHEFYDPSLMYILENLRWSFYRLVSSRADIKSSFAPISFALLEAAVEFSGSPAFYSSVKESFSSWRSFIKDDPALLECTLNAIKGLVCKTQKLAISTPKIKVDRDVSAALDLLARIEESFSGSAQSSAGACVFRRESPPPHGQDGCRAALCV